MVNHKYIERYHSRKKAGLCVECGHARTGAAATITYCASCAQLRRERQLARRLVRIHKSCCIDCGKRTRYATRCKVCCKIQAHETAVRRAEAIAFGMCGRCRTEPLAPRSKTMCVGCAKAHRQRVLKSTHVRNTR